MARKYSTGASKKVEKAMHERKRERSRAAEAARP